MLCFIVNFSFYLSEQYQCINLLCRYDADFEKLRELTNNKDQTAKDIAADSECKLQMNSMFIFLFF
jgi:hypothetical protein